MMLIVSRLLFRMRHIYFSGFDRKSSAQESNGIALESVLAIAGLIILNGLLYAITVGDKWYLVAEDHRLAVLKIINELFRRAGR